MGYVTDYLNFSTDQVVPVKTVKCFGNNKPWITSEVKKVLNNKKRVFKCNNSEMMRQVQNEVKTTLRKAKEAYSKKLERKLRANNTHEVWNGMKTGLGSKSHVGCLDLQRAEELNSFFNQFSSSQTTGSPP